ncbi:uncharacterized protein LOC128203446 isoform X2 [Mya arenaria]|uniref:uncharacterized protein LOC128203446 isoform X2 n=1 Tax=Mya arenaria TaxID=6604 RepID=UPI0022E60D53|nr:uncharacterized protein LOC128203446 isoform X2 [Mya arenaria]
MKLSSTMWCEVVSIVIVMLTILSASLAAPLDTFYPTDDSDIINPQKLELLKDLREVLAIEERNKEQQYAKRFDNSEEQTGLARVMPQKRFRPFRTQTRGGGVALCLWKVCPAAPWLVSKR